jgi:methylmalonyl-CoA mutase
MGQLVRRGGLTKDKNNFDSLNLLSTAIPNSSIIRLMPLYQNAGTNMVQQLAYSLAHVNEYFNRIPVIGQPIVIEVAVGTNYFFEIAKLQPYDYYLI